MNIRPTFEQALAYLGPIYNNPAIYDHQYRGKISLELELVTCRTVGGKLEVVSEADKLLLAFWEKYPNLKQYVDVEFSNHQVEVKTDPDTPEQMVSQLTFLLDVVDKFTEGMGLCLVAKEYLEGDIPTELSPLKPYYAEYATKHPQRVDPMCRVASLQFKVGVRKLDEAILVQAALARAQGQMIADGWLHPMRWAAFDEVICTTVPRRSPRETIIRGQWISKAYKDFTDVIKRALIYDWAMNPRFNYESVRIHEVQGAVELRIGGPTRDLEEILRRARFVMLIANEALKIPTRQATRLAASA